MKENVKDVWKLKEGQVLFQTTIGCNLFQRPFEGVLILHLKCQRRPAVMSSVSCFDETDKNSETDSSQQMLHKA